MIIKVAMLDKVTNAYLHFLFLSMVLVDNGVNEIPFVMHKKVSADIDRILICDSVV